uniref:Uncharacterized protein n=1 Tax=Octopus bimaculoides TaxID=37653 RepID=A0A0L8HLP0_OCTBM
MSILRVKYSCSLHTNIIKVNKKYFDNIPHLSKYFKGENGKIGLKKYDILKYWVDIGVSSCLRVYFIWVATHSLSLSLSHILSLSFSFSNSLFPSLTLSHLIYLSSVILPSILYRISV